MAETEANERPHTSRNPIELKVEYQQLNSFFSDYTLNISKGGTFIKTDKPLPLGTEFIFQLTIPELEAPIRLHGAVKWIVTQSDASEDSIEAGMGITFIYGHGHDAETTDQIVKKLMTESLGKAISEQLMKRTEDTA